MILPFLAVAGLALVHVFSPVLSVLDRVPRSRWLSFGGGVAVTLVFLEIIPELAEYQQTLSRSLTDLLGFLDRHIYLLALVALTAFYVTQRVVKGSRSRHREATGQDTSGEGAFWLKLGVVATKNAIVGYLLVREDRTPVALLLFFLAIGMEFTISDRGMHEDHKEKYDRLGRWVLAAGVAAGAALGRAVELPELTLAVLSAVLAGFIILNVFSEELPDERDSSVGAFTSGLVVYSALQLAL
ncbi:hypothetical protein E9529_11965 [Blastococcus sp. KM273128]|uniref:hypothetical protein n=1 Tax=Blastococcus sp. KM273128 TaxID=2570314 RepID=UPI001F3187E5|nr:hypothetical protein [Blastococcus sp. KM273128]MCF6744984.1 hypothetical protein [Blastococcus sp. KM273128]